MKSKLCEEEWSLVKALLPKDLEARARNSHALRSARGVKNADTLLRLLFLHVAGVFPLSRRL